MFTWIYPWQNTEEWGHICCLFPCRLLRIRRGHRMQQIPRWSSQFVLVNRTIVSNTLDIFLSSRPCVIYGWWLKTCRRESMSKIPAPFGKSTNSTNYPTRLRICAEFSSLNLCPWFEIGAAATILFWLLIVISMWVQYRHFGGNKSFFRSIFMGTCGM